MKAKQLYFLLLALFIVSLGALFGVAYGANKLMEKQATKLSKLRADDDVLSTLQVSLARNKQDITKYGELNTIAETIVPQDKDQAEAVREIVNLAAQSGISKLSSITFPVSNLGASASTGPVSATVQKTNTNLTQLTPVKGIAGVYELQITVTQTTTDEVPYSQLTAFLEKLEQNRRTAQVSSITVTPDASNVGQVAFNLVINEFIKP